MAQEGQTQPLLQRADARYPDYARWEIAKAGCLDDLKLITDGDGPKQPGHGEVLVEVHAVGLNMADMFACLGLYSATPKGAFTPGLEFAGVVKEIGPEMGVDIHRSINHPLKVGDRVMGCTRFGGYATHVTVGACYVRIISNGWSFHQGAAYIAQGLTAWYGLVDLGQLRRIKNPVVLVHSAAGGVGLFALEIVRKMGGHVIATVGNHGKKEMLVDKYGLKQDQVIVRSGGGNTFGQALDRPLASVGASHIDIVFDSLLGDYMMPAYNRLGPMGRHLVFGAASFTPTGSRPNWLRLAWQWLWRPTVDPMEMISQNRALIGFNLIWLWDKVDEMTSTLGDMMAEWEWDPPHVGHVLPFTQAKEALQLIQSGTTTGKVVLDVIMTAKEEGKKTK
eukprot:comp21041_c0_seq1/m.28278 comp21041_c0_seq1/g.28278  ORF comp21041_c0_seq1/g.28278 comp21041_c0_seq1/m.28278 type:complete len:392 (-) comp21041_c0_seq1:473-1648(-)